MIQAEDGTTLKAAIREPKTDLARVVSGIDDLVIEFRQAGISWDRIAKTNERADLLADELLAIARDCAVSCFTDDQPTMGLDHILKASTVGLLHESWTARVDSPAFRYGLRKPTEWKPMELPGQSMFDIHTHRDHMSMFPEYNAAEFEPGWMVGKLSAVTVSLQETDQWSEGLGDPHRLLRQNSKPDRSWEAGARIFEDTPGSDLTGFEYGLKRPLKLPARILPSLSAQVSSVDSVDRLAALLGRRSKLIGSRDSRSMLHIDTIVSGLACTLPDEESIDILRIVHGSEPHEVNPVSLAVLMPAPTSLGDSSEWWVFDRAYRIRGLDASDDQWVSRINGTGERLGKHISWIDLNEVPVDSLLSLCDYRSFQRLRSQFEELERAAKNIRGVIPELLSAQLLSEAGYHPVRTSLKVTFPNGVKREMDAVGIRLTTAGGECKIIEVKGQSDSQHALKRYVHRFNETVQLADTHRSVVQDAVGCSEAIEQVSGLFISMAKDFRVPDHFRGLGIAYWDLGQFVAELRVAGFDDRYLDLLQESLVVWENDFGDI